MLRKRLLSNLAFVAVLSSFISGCSADGIDEWMESGTRTWSCESSSSVQRAQNVITSQDFATTGYSESDKQDFEKKFGNYFGTFEGVAIFGLKTDIDDDGKRLLATVITKQPLRKLTIAGELDDNGLLNEFTIEQSNEAHPFKRMKFDVGYGSTSDEQLPTVRITKVERKE